MRLVMTVAVKDEEDILDTQLAFHLNAGVDFVIATDTGSTDGTLDILERYRRDGVLELRRDDTRPFRHGDVVTAMARAAAAEFEADWIINADADEFWWPRGNDLKDVLRVVPARYGVVYGVWRPFVPVAEDGTPFYERMTWRVAPGFAIHNPGTKFRPNVKAAHRASRDIRVIAGNHEVTNVQFPPLRGWYPIEVLHFPVRGGQQLASKLVNHRHNAGKMAFVGQSAPGASDDDAFMEIAIDSDVTTDGIAAGVLVEDVRLRDVLRELAGSGTPPSEVNGSPRAHFGRPSIVEDARFAGEVAVLGDADVIRAQRRLDDLERRLGVVEKSPTRRLGRGLRSLARRARPRA